MSASFPIGRAVLEPMLRKFSSNVDGFNVTFNALAPIYGVPATMAIDFTPSDNKSMNFALANVDAPDWIASGAYKFPLFTMFVEKARNMNNRKFMMFSGEVTAGINIWLNWDSPRLKLTDFEPLSGCVEETVVSIMNRAREGFDDQFWNDDDADVVYNGDIDWTRSPVKRGDSFWAQVIQFRMMFDVDQGGPR
jgi:hypothetical protein